MAMSPKNNYYPALDGLRAIAAFTVIWTHIERFKQFKGEATISDIPFNSFIGGMAVSFFFVLSGFLITDILLREQIETGSIQIRRFLRNRFLRIGPLYFLTLIAGYIVSIFVLRDTSSDPLSNGLLLNFLMLSNIAFALNLIPEILIQIWSIGTEVQFYFSWPFLVKGTNTRKLTVIFIAIVASWMLVRAGLYMTAANKSVMSVILFRTRFDCMAIGGLAALMNKGCWTSNTFVRRFSRFLLTKPAGMLSAVLFLMMLFASWKFDLSLYPIYSALFASLIYRWINHPPKVLTNSFLQWLGKISYGIYLLHHFAVYIVFAVLIQYFGSSRLSEIYYFLSASLLTIILALLSYFGIETKFLRMKEKSLFPTVR
jgi:peptidoglycan/LPS O-acetylase OafA/YrhL